MLFEVFLEWRGQIALFLTVLDEVRNFQEAHTAY
jgi:hypothetical protein